MMRQNLQNGRQISGCQGLGTSGRDERKKEGDELQLGFEKAKQRTCDVWAVQHLDFGGGYTSILSWKTLWTKELGSLQSMASQKVGHNWVTECTHTHTHTPTNISDKLQKKNFHTHTKKLYKS